MRYFYEKPDNYTTHYGSIHKCRHPVYTRATLYLLGKEGLCVIQQRYDKRTKHTYWSEIDPWLVDELYLHPGFYEYLTTHASLPDNDIYPTVPVRKLMWALKMKPLKKEPWETTFDRPFV